MSRNRAAITNSLMVLNAELVKDGKDKINIQLANEYLEDEDLLEMVNAGQYKFDWLMLAALAFQESGIDQSKKSHVGAVGIMQVMPSTAKNKNVGIPNIEEIEANIHAGTKYLRFMMDRYFDDPEIDTLNRGLFSFAAYNAGPVKVSKLRKEAAKMGLDPNVWFRNVEIVAAKRIGRETVQYVSNIFKYYLAYRYIPEQNNSKTN